MKKTLIILCLMLTASWSQATLFRFPTTGSLGLGITDGSPVGVVAQGTVSGLDPFVTAITVGLNITGGFDGNLYAYLVAPNGTVVTLLNHIGTGTFGSLASGLGNGNDGSFLLTSGSGNNLTTGANGTRGTALTGTFNLAGLSGFQTGTTTANGTWTLFFADTVRGGGTSTLNSWTLNITAVPEPVVLALVTFAAMLLALTALKWAWRTQKTAS